MFSLDCWKKHTYLLDGYKHAAVTTEISDIILNAETNATKKGKQKTKPQNQIPEPLNTAEYMDLGIKLYNRINFLVNDVSSLYKIAQSKVVKSYDIISFQPGDATVLKTLCTTSNFDILCFNPSLDHPMLYYSRKVYNQFVKNGVFMELPYSPAILDASYRKYLITTANMYQSVGGATNVIVTSAAHNANYVRSPYDVINLCSLYCLSEQQAKQAISSNCEKLLMHARTRRRGKCIIEMDQLRQVEAMEIDSQTTIELS